MPPDVRFKAKMHKIRFPLGFCSRPRWGAYSAPPDLLAVFKGPTSQGREGAEGRGSEGRGGARPQIFWPRTAPAAAGAGGGAEVLPILLTAHLHPF